MTSIQALANAGYLADLLTVIERHPFGSLLLAALIALWIWRRGGDGPRAK